MKIAVATDHAGFETLKALKSYLVSKGHEILDFGPKTFEPDDDYPDLILPAARAVANGEAERGIIMGSSGQGEAMVANRVKGVRCALYYGPASPPGAVDADGKTAEDELELLRLSREHNNANMLSLAARFLSQTEIEHAVSIWLEAPFTGVERHARRVKKLDELT